MKKLKNRDYVKFIDPTNSGSFVGYRIGVDQGYEFINIKLGDCNRSISWDISKDKQGIKKIDNAINVLSKLKKELEALGIT